MFLLYFLIIGLYQNSVFWQLFSHLCPVSAPEKDFSMLCSSEDSSSYWLLTSTATPQEWPASRGPCKCWYWPSGCGCYCCKRSGLVLSFSDYFRSSRGHRLSSFTCRWLGFSLPVGVALRLTVSSICADCQCSRLPWRYCLAYGRCAALVPANHSPSARWG